MFTKDFPILSLAMSIKPENSPIPLIGINNTCEIMVSLSSWRTEVNLIEDLIWDCEWERRRWRLKLEISMNLLIWEKNWGSFVTEGRWRWRRWWIYSCTRSWNSSRTKKAKLLIYLSSAPKLKYGDSDPLFPWYRTIVPILSLIALLILIEFMCFLIRSCLINFSGKW